MEQFYSILYYPSFQGGGMGFTATLFPKWKEAVALNKVTQEDVDEFIIYDGYDQLIAHFPWIEKYMPWSTENPLYEGKTMEDFSNEERFIHISSYLNIKWGEWGPEHISVPGSGSGLDIESSPYSDHAKLTPHNIDDLKQGSLLFFIFFRFVSSLEYALNS